jgi:hypothetical protein
VSLGAYAGAFGLLTGNLSFDALIESRLPWDSYPLAAAALLGAVALPMTAAAVTAWRGSPAAPSVTFVAGLSLVVWIAVQLAFIQSYSFFQPVYLVLGAAVSATAWAMRRTPPPRG